MMGFFNCKKSKETEPLIHDLNDPPDKRLSWIMGAFLLINTTIGAGLLNFPTTFYQAGGIINTLILQFWIICLILIAMHILLYLTHICVLKFLSSQNQNQFCSRPPDSYEEIIGYYCGFKMQIFVSVTIILYAFGTCVTYLIITADQLEKITFHIYGNTTHWYIGRNIDLIFVTFSAILPMCFSKGIKFLSIPSTFGTFAMIYLPVLLLVQYYIPKPFDILPHKYELQSNIFSHNVFYGIFNSFQFTSSGIFQVIPTICFLYNAQLSVTPTYHTLGVPHGKTVVNFSKSIFINIVVCAVIYNITGIYGYLGFGEKVLYNTDILTAFDPIDFKIMFAMVLLVVKIITTFPIVTYCARITMINTAESIFNSYHTYKDKKRISSANKNDHSNGGLADSTNNSSQEEGGEEEDEKYYEPYISPDWFFLKRWYTTFYRSVRDYLAIDDRAERAFRIIVACIWILVTVILTIYVPNIGKIIPFLGSLSLLLLFVFPGLAFMVHILDEKSKMCSLLSSTKNQSPERELGPTTSSNLLIATKITSPHYGTVATELNEQEDGLPDLTFSSDGNFVTRRSNLLIGVSILLVLIGTFLFGTVLTRAIIDIVHGN